MIVPFASGTVTTLVVKASQGGGTSSGQAWLYHDAVPFDEDGAVASNPCTLAGTPNTSVCFIDGLDVNLSLLFLDSLSVFVKTDGGSFEGASACVLIADPVTATGPPPPAGPMPPQRKGG